MVEEQRCAEEGRRPRSCWVRPWLQCWVFLGRRPVTFQKECRRAVTFHNRAVTGRQHLIRDVIARCLSCHRPVIVRVPVDFICPLIWGLNLNRANYARALFEMWPEPKYDQKKPSNTPNPRCPNPSLGKKLGGNIFKWDQSITQKSTERALPGSIRGYMTKALVSVIGIFLHCILPIFTPLSTPNHSKTSLAICRQASCSVFNSHY